MAKKRVVIEVEGGLVQCIYTNDPTIEIEVVDCDNLHDTMDSSEVEAAVRKAVKGLKPV